MNKIQKISLLLLLAGVLVMSSCSRNYYSGSGKGSKCGCPSNI